MEFIPTSPYQIPPPKSLHFDDWLPAFWERPGDTPTYLPAYFKLYSTSCIPGPSWDLNMISGYEMFGHLFLH